jgi:hypothetical protein
MRPGRTLTGQQVRPSSLQRPSLRASRPRTPASKCTRVRIGEEASTSQRCPCMATSLPLIRCSPMSDALRVGRDPLHPAVRAETPALAGTNSPRMLASSPAHSPGVSSPSPPQLNGFHLPPPAPVASTSTSPGGSRRPPLRRAVTLI